MPGPGCPPTPESALEECVRAAQHLLSDTIQRHEKVPWIEPPYRARFECKHVQGVLTTTAGVNGPTNAAGTLMIAANTVPGSTSFTPVTLEMTAVDSYRPLFELEPQQGFMCRIKSWGITANVAGPKSVLIRLKAATVGGTPTPPDPFLSNYQVPQHQDTFVILQPKQKLTVEVALRDVTAGPVLLDFGICYWFWPINKRTDQREGAILRSGYGVDCP
jgi:hypothetical protein